MRTDIQVNDELSIAKRLYRGSDEHLMLYIYVAVYAECVNEK